mmetsp:Transcript_1186/g.7750  ORF Transcript_1186/g.7750 Transcript_1186/m.7750 type:complete len:324 (+) Transcript_1186:2224-3195(+)
MGIDPDHLSCRVVFVIHSVCHEMEWIAVGAKEVVDSFAFLSIHGCGQEQAAPSCSIGMFRFVVPRLQKSFQLVFALLSRYLLKPLHQFFDCLGRMFQRIIASIHVFGRLGYGVHVIQHHDLAASIHFVHHEIRVPVLQHAPDARSGAHVARRAHVRLPRGARHGNSGDVGRDGMDDGRRVHDVRGGALRTSGCREERTGGWMEGRRRARGKRGRCGRKTRGLGRRGVETSPKSRQARGSRMVGTLPGEGRGEARDRRGRQHAPTKHAKGILPHRQRTSSLLRAGVRGCAVRGGVGTQPETRRRAKGARPSRPGHARAIRTAEA